MEHNDNAGCADGFAGGTLSTREAFLDQPWWNREYLMHFLVAGCTRLRALVVGLRNDRVFLVAGCTRQHDSVVWTKFTFASCTSFDNNI
jgi:hypothetical protein